MNHLQDLSVLVLGLGDSGLAMARWCARFGARVTVWDSREDPPQAAALAQDAPQAVLHRGDAWTGDPARALAGVQLVLKSPGLSPLDVKLRPLLAHAARSGVLVQGELELFARALVDLKSERDYAPAVVAITGTNGKTTTATLTARLVERAGRRVALAGNIGPTMLDTLAAALDLEPVIVSDFGKLDEDEQGEASNDAGDHAGAAAAAVVLAGSGSGSDADHSVLDEHGVVEQAMAAGAQPPNPAEAPAASDAASAVDFEPLADGIDHAGAEVTADPSPRAEAEVDVEEGMSMSGASPGDEQRPLPIPLPPPPGPVFEHLPEVWVLELSSFQLDGSRSFEPTAAVVLNVTEDHLDWHGSMDDYAAAKARIYGPMETSNAVMVGNRDDELVMAMLELPLPELLASKAAGKAAGSVTAAKAQARRRMRHAARPVVRFGLGAPAHPGDFGVLTQNGMAWLVRAQPADPTIKRKPGAPADELSIQRLMPADALLVRGRHNWSNALAALSLATAIGCPLAPMLHGLREYAGEAHRVQFVASVDGVEAFDDSKGTNVGATVAALNGLGADRSPARIVVILGGDGKGQNFEPLRAPVARYARAIATIGRDAATIEAVLATVQHGDIPMQRHDTLEAATRWAFAQARSGDAVLLSPACASLDMFRNYAHRAEVFVHEVQSMARDAGEIA